MPKGIHLLHSYNFLDSHVIHHTQTLVKVFFDTFPLHFEGAKMDYSLASFDVVEKILWRGWEEKIFDRAYFQKYFIHIYIFIGETFIHNYGGKWTFVTIKEVQIPLIVRDRKIFDYSPYLHDVMIEDLLCQDALPVISVALSRIKQDFDR